MDLPQECIVALIRGIVYSKSRDWKVLGHMAETNSEYRNSIGYVLGQEKRWDDVMIQAGKVSLERLAVACGIPGLRARAVRYVEGKKMFLYKNLVIQLDRASTPISMQVLYNRALVFRATTRAYGEEHDRHAYGVSLMCKKESTRPLSEEVGDPEALIRPLLFLRKIKPGLDRMVDEMAYTIRMCTDIHRNMVSQEHPHLWICVQGPNGEYTSKPGEVRCFWGVRHCLWAPEGERIHYGMLAAYLDPEHAYDETAIDLETRQYPKTAKYHRLFDSIRDRYMRRRRVSFGEDG